MTVLPPNFPDVPVVLRLCDDCRAEVYNGFAAASTKQVLQGHLRRTHRMALWLIVGSAFVINLFLGFAIAAVTMGYWK